MSRRASNVDSQRLLRFAGGLQRAIDFDALMRVAHREICEVTGYAHTWLCVLEPDGANARLLAFLGDGDHLAWEHAQRIPVAGDAMMEEIVRGGAPVVVHDARTDPRTNKDIVAKLGNRTIINVPLALIDCPLGAFGMGTFGDEGPRSPTTDQLDYLVAMASQVSVAVARIRLLEEREVIARDRAIVQRRVLVAQKMESLGLLAGGVAHDLNNLLMIILLNASGIGAGSLSDAQRADLEALASAARRGAALTKQLLGVSRPQPDKLEVVDVQARLNDLARLVRRALPPDITLDVVDDPAAPACLGDATQIDQVFMNLCVNARDAMASGGRLLIETSEVVLGVEYLEAYPWARPGRYLRVAVSDTGCGIAADVIERIFEPYFTTKEPGKGTGLGLAVAYGIVRQHGGLMHAYSEVGVGTTIKVHLPAYKPGDAGLPERLEGPPPLGGARILVADDDASVRSLVIRILGDAGYSVVTAVDGAEAVAAVLRESIDLVILDIIMPKISGQDAFLQIRAVRPEMPCLFSTGYAPDLLPGGMRADAAIEVLQKPYEAEQLLRAVHRALDLRRR